MPEQAYSFKDFSLSPTDLLPLTTSRMKTPPMCAGSNTAARHPWSPVTKCSPWC
jgi:hypothetical protein